MTELYAAVDFHDEVYKNKLFPDLGQLEKLIRELKSLGVSRVEWIVDDVWALYDGYPHGFDLLAEVVRLAHEAGIEIDALIKPFEGALHSRFLPHAAPRPEGVPLWEDDCCLLPVVRPFVAAHPEMCMQLRPGMDDPATPICAIEITADGQEPLDLKADDLALRAGERIGRLQPLEVSFHLKEEATDGHRSLILGGLDLPAEWRYLEICMKSDRQHQRAGTRPVRRIEAFDSSGRTLPVAHAFPKMLECWRLHTEPFMQRLTRWGHCEEAQAFLQDEETLNRLDRERFLYHQSESQTLETGVAFKRGYPRHMPGVLNPVYADVREHWLDYMRFCLDKGVDGVNLRHTYHMRYPNVQDYGFNPPVLERLEGRTDAVSAQTVIAAAYTDFLRQARDLLHERGKRIGLHLCATMLRGESVCNYFPGIGSDWRTWVDEIADYAEFRGKVGDNEQAMEADVMPFARACHGKGVAFIYQSLRTNIVQIRKQGPSVSPELAETLRREMALVDERPEITAYLLYETANFTEYDRDGGFRCSQDLKELIAEA